MKTCNRWDKSIFSIVSAGVKANILNIWFVRFVYKLLYNYSNMLYALSNIFIQIILISKKCIIMLVGDFCCVNSLIPRMGWPRLNLKILHVLKSPSIQVRYKLCCIIWTLDINQCTYGLWLNVSYKTCELPLNRWVSKTSRYIIMMNHITPTCASITRLTLRSLTFCLYKNLPSFDWLNK